MKKNLTVLALMAFATICVAGLVAMSYAPAEQDTRFVQNALSGLAGVALGIVGGMIRPGPSDEEIKALSGAESKPLAVREIEQAKEGARIATLQIELEKEKAKKEIRKAQAEVYKPAPPAATSPLANFDTATRRGNHDPSTGATVDPMEGSAAKFDEPLLAPEQGVYGEPLNASDVYNKEGG